MSCQVADLFGYPHVYGCCERAALHLVSEPSWLYDLAKACPECKTTLLIKLSDGRIPPIEPFSGSFLQSGDYLGKFGMRRRSVSLDSCLDRI